ncbi:MAG TPA: cell division protein FtsZ [Bacteroidales bacterium]|nr:cell division protein FtsZ [Bacteroidales bacterium]HPR12452.1 cell division protein FtsZ [Bacteroidales bacterium]HRW84517.1 cell division protein FtsZ [Bacteroidales bacterium]
MADDIMNFDLPVEMSSIIKVLGIGGGGNNAVNHMFEKGIRDVNFVVCNTDHQALQKSPVPVKVQIGQTLTEGMGAGSQPEKGKKAALENLDDVMKTLGGNTRMVFITTGMGGGTGTGAIPVIAKACREAGILTIAVVTLPFKSEGRVRIRYAIDGITELKDHVDSLLVINNEKLREIYGNLGVSSAFTKADDVLTTAVKGIAEIITVTGYINVDFADVETVMKDSGVAIMGMGMAEGENRALRAIENALASPLLNSNDITGAKSILINISSGKGEHEITMDELGEITDYMYDAASDDALIIRGLSQDEDLGGNINVTVIATGFEANSLFQHYRPKEKSKVDLFADNTIVPPKVIAERSEGEIKVLERKKKSIISDFDDESQGIIDFGNLSHENENHSRGRKQSTGEEDDENNETTLKKVKHIQNILRKEGLSNKTIKENIDTFEDVPAYIRRNMPVITSDKKSDSKLSRFTLTSDDEEGPVLRENNAYLNDNVD